MQFAFNRDLKTKKITKNYSPQKNTAQYCILHRYNHTQIIEKVYKMHLSRRGWGGRSNIFPHFSSGLRLPGNCLLLQHGDDQVVFGHEVVLGHEHREPTTQVRFRFK